MKLNTKKTKLILFNPGWARDFIPEFSVDGSEIEVVEEIKFLGVVLSNDLSWSANIDYMTKRCNKKLWIMPSPPTLSRADNIQLMLQILLNIKMPDPYQSKLDLIKRDRMNHC